MQPPPFAALAHLRLLVLDIDGVLTDGGLYYSVDGLQLKRFHSKDGLGLKLLMLGGIQVALLTGDHSPIATTRAQRLGIPTVLMGVEDKLQALSELAQRLNIPLSQVGYMGDDLNDLPCIVAAGFGAAPADAVREVKRAANYVCELQGGTGCVREVCDLIRHAQKLALPAHFSAPTLDEPLVVTEFDAAP